MNVKVVGSLVASMALGAWLAACTQPGDRGEPARSTPQPVAREQVAGWSNDDLAFHLHGSMSTEVVPETVLKAFIATYPQIFPSSDFSHLGAIPDPAFGWPVGFTRARPAHLAKMTSIGINCAACHTAEFHGPDGATPVRVLGVTAMFDAEAFFGSLVAASLQTQNPANMKRFLANYLQADRPAADQAERSRRENDFDAAWQKQAGAIAAAIAADPAGAKDAGAGGLQTLSADDLAIPGDALDRADLPRVAASMLKLFHNMRTALHVPDQLPEKLPPPSGPGRNDAFGLLSASLFGQPQPLAPVKYGIVWNVRNRPWVHWDGNTRSPLARNILAAAGLGAPLVGKEGRFDLALVKRQTDLSEGIRAPRYPYAIDRIAAARGAALYQASCASCHDGREDDGRLYSPAVVGTDPLRAELFTPRQAERFNQFLAELRSPGYQPPKEPGIRSTQKYWSPGLAGVWARPPYLHNGSVRTMRELLMPAWKRASQFHKGTMAYDPVQMGYADGGTYLMDTRVPGNQAIGHEYGTELRDDQKRDLIEYLKTQ